MDACLGLTEADGKGEVITLALLLQQFKLEGNALQLWLQIGAAEGEEHLSPLNHLVLHGIHLFHNGCIGTFDAGLRADRLQLSRQIAGFFNAAQA